MTASDWYIFGASVVWFVHVAYVIFVVGGQLSIIIGSIAGWLWVGSLGFRLAHLSAIGIVAFETIIDVACTLTVLQDYFLLRAGLLPRGFNINPFNTPRGFWDATYLVFAALVILTFVLAPPRLPWNRRNRRASPARQQVLTRAA
jgi:hypothetical protein